MSWDGACDPRACHAAIAQVQLHLQASIAPRKNAGAWKSTQTGAASRSEAPPRTCQRLGRRL